jgi:hypothetical protein
LVGGVWSGFTWLRIGMVGGLLWMRWWTFGFWRHRDSSLTPGKTEAAPLGCGSLAGEHRDDVTN